MYLRKQAIDEIQYLCKLELLFSNIVKRFFGSCYLVIYLPLKNSLFSPYISDASRSLLHRTEFHERDEAGEFKYVHR